MILVPLLTLPATHAGSVVPVGREIVVSDSGTHADLAYGIDAEFAVTWVEEDVSARPRRSVRMQRFGPTASPVGPAVAVQESFDEEGFGPWAPRIDHTSPDDFIVVWFEETLCCGDRILARSFDPNGTPTRSQLDVSGEPRTTATFPDIACVDEDDCMVVWHARAQQPDGQFDTDIYARNVGPPLAGLGDVFRVNADTSSPRQQLASIDAASDLEYLVVWQRSTNGVEDAAEVAARSVSVDGVPGDEHRANGAAPTLNGAAAVAADSFGSTLTVWHRRSPADDSSDIFARRFDSDGAPLSTEFQVNAERGEANLYPRIDTLTSGSFVVVWERRATTIGSPSLGIFGRTYDAEAVAEGPEFRVGGGAYPQVAGGFHDTFAVVWDSGRAVSLQRFTHDPTCGDADADANRTASDGLIVLRAAVGLEACVACLCDADGRGGVTATDALALIRSVPTGDALACPVCG